VHQPTPRDVPEGRRSLPGLGGSPRLPILSLIHLRFLASDTDLHDTPRHCSAQASLFLFNRRPTCYCQRSSHAIVSVAISLCVIWGENSVEVLLLVVCFHVGVLWCKVTLLWLYFKFNFVVFVEREKSTLTFRRPCVVMYLYNESQRDALFLKFIS